MYQGKSKDRILIVVPSYHEEKNILHVIEGLKQNVPDYDVLIVDDGSRDETQKIANDKGVKTLKHPFNMGYGVAIQTGYKHAVRYDYDIVVQFDGDDQHDPRFIKPIIKELKESGADVVIGSRFLNGHKSNLGFQRKIGVKLFSWIASVITGQKITDATSGLQALDKKVFRFFSTMENFPYDYPDADLIITLWTHGFSFKECPVIMHNRMHGRSMTSGLNAVVYVAKMLISILIVLIRKRGKRTLSREK